MRLISIFGALFSGILLSTSSEASSLKNYVAATPTSVCEDTLRFSGFCQTEYPTMDKGLYEELLRKKAVNCANHSELTVLKDNGSDAPYYLFGDIEVITSFDDREPRQTCRLRFHKYNDLGGHIESICVFSTPCK